MDRGIPESDWKLFRQLRTLALDRFCQHVLAELTELAANAKKRNHDRYLAVFELLQRRDDELANAFNNPRRSTALFQLAHIQFQKLLTDQEFARFSPETRASVNGILEIGRDRLQDRRRRMGGRWRAGRAAGRIAPGVGGGTIRIGASDP